MTNPQPGDVTRLLVSWSGGNRAALDELAPFLYNELRRLAGGYLRRQRQGHTLQPTALVHEAYLKLVDQTQVRSGSRAQFFAIAANLMRQILVDHERRHRAIKRGGGNKVDLDDAMGVVEKQPFDVLALDEALRKLAQLDPRQSQIVEMRFFGGLTEDQIAEVLGVSPITVKRGWRVARAVLLKELRGTELD